MKFYKAKVPDGYNKVQKTEAEIHAEVMDYYNSYGKDGFGSERMDINMIGKKVENELLRQKQQPLISFLISACVVDLPDDILECEKRTDFIHWIEFDANRQYIQPK